MASDAEAELEAFIARFTPEIATKARACIAAMRAKLPGAQALIYDNYNALAVAFGAGTRMADIAFSIAVYPKWVSLFLVGGQTLDDPNRLLKGSGGTMRHIVLASADDLADPRIERLMAAALALKPIPIGPAKTMIVKSVSAKQRPRRPG